MEIEQGGKKFEAKIPVALADKLEAWMTARDLSNRQILKAMIRTFLSAPEPVQLAALNALDDAELDLAAIKRAWIELFASLPVTPKEYEERILRDVKSRAKGHADRKSATA